MRRSLALSVKLPFLILVVILLVLASVSVFINNTAQSVILKSKSDRIEDIAKATGSSIGVQLQRAGQNMVVVAGLPTIQESLLLPLSQGMTSEKASLTSLFNRLKLAYGYYESFYLVNPDGKIIAGSSNSKATANSDVLSSRLVDAALKRNTFITTDLYRSPETGEILLPVALKVVYSGRSGALIGTLQLSKITSTVLQESSVPGVRIFIASEDGTIVAALSSQKIGSKKFSETPWFAEMREQVSGSMDVFMGEQTKSVGFYHIPQTNLYSIVIADKSYMASSLVTIHKAILWAAALGLLLAVGCTCFIIIPVTRDIKKLSRFARQITEGDRTVATGVKRDDELGDLAESLSLMVGTLTESLQRSEEATKAKSEFLARMSHEIRTPMNGIIGISHLAMRDTTDQKQKEYLCRIDNSAKILLGVINDILDFSKIEARKMELESKDFSLSLVLRSVYDMISINSLKKDLKLEFVIAEDVPDFLRGDALRLAQVCVNICGNAVKFTEKGSVALYVSIDQVFEDGLSLLFCVKDTGIGMTMEQQGVIFNSFAQADGSITRKYGGTGLGLAISKSLIEMMGGKIWLQSTPCEGTSFFFTISLARGKGTASPQIKEQGSEKGRELFLDGARVLLAEDNEINSMIAMEILTDMGAKVLVAQNGAEALDLWNDGEFDLVILDIQMPVMDGLTAAKEIRAHPKANSRVVPIIAMTANAMEADREKSLQAGMNDHITKPLDIANLECTLAKWYKKNNAPQSPGEIEGKP